MSSDSHGDAPPGQDDGLVVASVPWSIASVRRYAVAECATLGWDGDRDTVELLVSEVATNALVHGDGQVRVRVLTAGSRLRVEVSDGSSDLPVPRHAADDAEGGRGLALVAALSTDWGVELAEGGKTVWFELGY